ncbi:UDP-N-acetylmuramoyl-L-alanyl-D-glutamate--2,6-diaminopimelate ligase [Pseudoduganella namucuonensis]|uniref:UDP-N-acetylmuramoyl-L-alanyl-D-glutamate--2,6-diaminopimelate ligase n=1 Tax=Pseudoduganella namucuonensis TaxID=1035707 RepID=A0A1I7EYQ6_9BURK|nr:UDP-N-acetylmuramoyl-L-alanyl-D-glutamate--2,6-diaminopimelate ligase [Pseudoduganella namucuonensis]SFU29063.1 UDP-N-acetylmuramoylalanyl-D-glutamate--2,6-diaminopimelate ligase [Pseudoduganella namucuonensis]
MSAMTPTEISNWIKQAAPDGQLASDSRRVKAGDVFFAYPGDGKDGRDYIAAAIAQGAAAVVLEAEGSAWDPAWTVPRLEVAGLKPASGPIAHAYYNQPDAAMYTVGVTGTNGKTSCAVWLGQAMSRLGSQTAVIGTLGVGMFRARGEVEYDPTGYTTPDAVLLARKLAETRDAGAQALAIEVTSIALDLGRTEGMHFDTALFTNLTRDHLDHHGDMAAYEAAKTKLFDWPGLKTAVVNLDDAMGMRLAQRMLARGTPVMGYTLADAAARPDIAGVAMLRASQFRTRSAGTEFHLDSPRGQAHVKTRLVGQFNISNALAVLGALLAKGVALRAAVDAIEALTPAPGRMQQVGGQDAPMVVIDYAHTPDALEKTLETLRQVARERGGQLWCVFGCGGDRDPGKRPQMGRIAQAADHVLVTSDNPRSEDPHAIIAQIVAGMEQNHPTSVFQTVEDRAAAILSAIKHAAKPDVILLAGKGHEPYQEIKGRKMPFSDADHAQLALSARLTMMRTN